MPSFTSEEEMTTAEIPYRQSVSEGPNPHGTSGWPLANLHKVQSPSHSKSSPKFTQNFTNYNIFLGQELFLHLLLEGLLKASPVWN